MELVSQVRTTIVENNLIERGETIVVGVSGGPDSLALLHALCALAPEFEIKLVAAHLNHQLRGAEADADAAFVETIAREWGLPAAVAAWDVASYAKENRLSLEEAGRILRYRFLSTVATQSGTTKIAVAHNADDQVETVLMHFLRGAGLAGLRGMAYRSRLLLADHGWRTADADSQAQDETASPFTIIRPLLDVPRVDVEIYCAAQGLRPKIDATNADRSLYRNRLRHEVIPYLEKFNPNLREVLRHAARSIADDYEYIQQNVLGIFDQIARPIPRGFVVDRKWFRALPVNLQRGVLREAVTRLRRSARNVSWTHIEAARRVAVEKDAGAEATLPHGLMLFVGYDDFTLGETEFVPDIPLLPSGQELLLQVDQTLVLPDSDWAVTVTTQPLQSGEEIEEGGDVWSAVADADRVVGELRLRTRKTGERFQPAGMRGKHKSVHEFMIDEKIPHHLRNSIPILADDEKILWVCGYRLDERARVTQATARALRVKFVKM